MADKYVDDLHFSSRSTKRIETCDDAIKEFKYWKSEFEKGKALDPGKNDEFNDCINKRIALALRVLKDEQLNSNWETIEKAFRGNKLPEMCANCVAACDTIITRLNFLKYHKKDKSNLNGKSA